MKTVVVMPTFNAEKYLVEAVTSIFDQTYQTFDLLILDGGSTDATVDICKILQGRDPRLSLISMPDTPPSARINSVIAEPRWDLIVMAHADDISLKYRLAEQVQCMTDRPEIIMTGGQTIFWSHEFESGKQQYSGVGHYPILPEQIRAQLPFWWCFSVPSVAINAAAFRRLGLRYDLSLEACSDWMMNWDAAKSGLVANIDKKIIAYRHHSASHGPRVTDTIEREVRTIRTRISNDIHLPDRLRPDELEQFRSMRFGASHVVHWGENAAMVIPLLEKLSTLDLSADGIDPATWRVVIDQYRRSAVATV